MRFIRFLADQWKSCTWPRRAEWGVGAVWIVVALMHSAKAPLPQAVFLGVFFLALAVAARGLWINRRRETPVTALWGTLCYVAAWQFLVVAWDGLGLYAFRANTALLGLQGLFLIGLAWVVWGVELASQHAAQLRRQRQESATVTWQGSGSAAAISIRSAPNHGREKGNWNPFDLLAWYYGERHPKLNQSIATLSGYTLLFMLLVLLISRLQGCQETYEMPAGGGKQTTVSQTVKIQKVIRKKFVVNPYSSILFNPPPIDEIKLQLKELTEHNYKIGQGEGEGAGYAGGTRMGKVRFIRLEYAGGDWDQDFGIGADLNMLVQYNVRTSQKVADRTESRTISQLERFPAKQSPPMVYLTGQRDISVSESEIATLKEYLLEKHGMLFCDNGGSRHFHNQFLSLMSRVLPNVAPVEIPMDDVIHRIPYPIARFPYVAPHGGKTPLGWKVEGRWVVYYHPGDIGDAWTDDHSGVSVDIYEGCYQLGTNIINYAHAEYSKWLTAQEQGETATPDEE